MTKGPLQRLFSTAIFLLERSCPSLNRQLLCCGLQTSSSRDEYAAHEKPSSDHSLLVVTTTVCPRDILYFFFIANFRCPPNS
jgi:hypothetical protein